MNNQNEKQQRLLDLQEKLKHLGQSKNIEEVFKFFTEEEVTPEEILELALLFFQQNPEIASQIGKQFAQISDMVNQELKTFTEDKFEDKAGLT